MTQTIYYTFYLKTKLIIIEILNLSYCSRKVKFFLVYFSRISNYYIYDTKIFRILFEYVQQYETQFACIMYLNIYIYVNSCTNNKSI